MFNLCIFTQGFAEWLTSLRMAMSIMSLGSINSSLVALSRLNFLCLCTSSEGSSDCSTEASLLLDSGSLTLSNVDNHVDHVTTCTVQSLVFLNR